MLNDFLEDLRRRANIQTVLEAPIYGMAGVSGINSIPLAQAGCAVTLVDDTPDRAEHIQPHLGRAGPVPEHPHHLARPVGRSASARQRSFDLAWNWAALWYLPDAAALLREMARLSRQLVFVAMPNNLQVGYWMRKLVLDQDFFPTVDERWVNIGLVRRTLEDAGVRIIATGVLDVPPWPDTVMPANEVLKRLGIRSKKLEDSVHRRWLGLEHDGLLPGRAARPARAGDEIRLAGSRPPALAGESDLGASSLAVGGS